MFFYPFTFKYFMSLCLICHINGTHRSGLFFTFVVIFLLYKFSQYISFVAIYISGCFFCYWILISICVVLSMLLYCCLYFLSIYFATIEFFHFLLFIALEFTHSISFVLVDMLENLWCISKTLALPRRSQIQG